MRNLLYLLFPFYFLTAKPPPATSVYTPPKMQAVSCGPLASFAVQSIYFAKATFIAKQSGNWNDINTWNGRLPNAEDIVGVPAGITVTFNTTATVKGLITDGDFIFAPGNSATLTVANGNFIYTSGFAMRPNSYLVKHQLLFTGINEAGVVGNGMEPLDSDPGLWGMGNARSDVKGETKTSMTEAVGSVPKGSNALTVKEALNWRIGDEITINPTNEIPQNQVNFDGSTLKFSDPYAEKYERRRITAIVGTRVTVDRPFTYDHLIVNNIWTAHVFNITRNVVIGGTATGRSHWFIRSTQPQSIQYVALPFAGPRNKATGDPDAQRGSIKSGRYALHFHHCMGGSIGSVVTGVAVTDCGTRAYVPHVSDGIYFKDNVAFNIAEDGFFWDFGDVSNAITYDHNGIMLQRIQGANGNPSGFFMGLGYDNVAINNFVSRGDRPITGVGGDYEWIADNDSPWKHEGNVSCTGHNGIQWWQNTPWIHLVFKYTSYNMYIDEDQSSSDKDQFAGGGIHGAYGNNVLYDSCVFYRAPFRIHASSGSRIGTKFTNCLFDGAGTVNYVVQVHGSAIPSGVWSMITKSVFRGYKKAAIQVYTGEFKNENAFKRVGLVDNTYSGKIVEFRAGSIYNSEVWVQNGNTASITKQTSVGGTVTNTAATNPFYQSNTSNGTGIVMRLYAGVNKDRLVKEEVVPTVHLPQVSVDPKSAPEGRHWKIGYDKKTMAVNPYSEEYVGFIAPLVTGNHQFQMKGAQAKRLTVNGVKLIDDWQDVSDEDYTVTSQAIYLEYGKKYPIKAESFNNAPPYTLYLSWNNPGNPGFEWIDRSQLFPDNSIVIPPDPINRPPVVSAGGNRTTYDTTFKVEGSASDPDNNLSLITWAGSSGLKVEQTLSEASHVLVTGKPGIYSLTITATDKAGLTSSNTATITILAKDTPVPVDTLQANAGADITASGVEVTLDGSLSKGATGATVNWYKDAGPVSWNITAQNNIITKANRLTPGVYTFRLKLTKGGVVSQDNVIVTIGTVTPVTYYSTRVSGTFTRSNCPVNNTPGSVTFSIKDSAYTSTVSQSTAQAIAVQALQTQGQAFANTTGSCIPANTPKTVVKIVIHYSDGSIKEILP